MSEKYLLVAIKRKWCPEWLYALQAHLFPTWSTKQPLRQIFNRELTAREDRGYPDHLAIQTKAPFYCGTAFCGHSTKKAARACWQKKHDTFEELTKAGKNPYEDASLYPERDPANWPINRSSAEMQAEYAARVKKEKP